MLTCRLIKSQCCHNYLDLMVDPPYLSCPDLVLPLFFPLFSTHFPYSPQKQWAALNMYLWELWRLIWRRKKNRLKVLVPFIGRTRSTRPIDAKLRNIIHFWNKSNIKMSLCETPLYQKFKCVIYFNMNKLTHTTTHNTRHTDRVTYREASHLKCYV